MEKRTRHFAHCAFFYANSDPTADYSRTYPNTEVHLFFYYACWILDSSCNAVGYSIHRDSELAVVGSFGLYSDFSDAYTYLA